MGDTWLVLDALPENTQGMDAVRAVVGDAIRAKGVDCDSIVLERCDVSPCKGCFGCWVQTPGICRGNDPARELCARIARAPTIVLLSPVSFGGYASALKIPLERGVLPVLLPFFQKVNGRTRHLVRYAQTPDMVGIGWLPRPDAELETTFRGVVARNAANMLSRRHMAVVLNGSQTLMEMRAQVEATLGEEALKKVKRRQKITLINGSPKKSKSHSSVFESYLHKKMEEAGAAVSRVHALAAYTDGQMFSRLAESLDEADGVALIYPLYADQLPGHLVSVLERIAARRGEIAPPRRQRFMAVAQCGFPEAVNNDASLEICRHFAREASFTWLGGCSIGGGGLYEGKDLDKLGWLGRKARKALDAKAALLVAEQEADAVAVRNSEVPCPVPSWLYLAMASRAWTRSLRADKGGIDGYARPYADETAKMA
ncbi:MAG: NAD(P)H-dependent oxidoreductase [Solidesulfovibrio sp. DCME]|uniref:NAD(P)H-dependent oxidoreductase n=1 Tax=Solidesulfovibrio sp. DCME TaxID=3447380 RepID=UPI003D10D5D5